MGFRLHVEMFGGLRAHLSSACITKFRTRKTSALFSYLAFHSERSHPREMLAELNWPGASVHASRNSLSQALTSLRHELSVPGVGSHSPMETNWCTAQLHCTTDVAEFEAAMRGAEGPRRADCLKAAMELYRGPLLSDLDDEWILTERSRLRDMFLNAAHGLSVLLREAGDLPGARRAAERAVGEDPLSELALRDLAQTSEAADGPLRGSRDLLEGWPGPEREPGARRPVLVRAQPAYTAVLQTPESSAREGAARAGTTTRLLVQLVCEPRRSRRWAALLAALHAKIRAEVEGLGVQLFLDEPLLIGADFAHPLLGVECAVRMRGELGYLRGPDGEPLDLRIALDTAFEPRRPRGSGSWLGGAMRKGEIVLSEATAALVRRSLEPDLQLCELGSVPAGAPGAEHFYRIESGAVAAASLA